MVVSESLLTERSIGRTTVFGNDKVVGVLSPQKSGEVVMVDTHDGKLQRCVLQCTLPVRKGTFDAVEAHRCVDTSSEIH